MEAGRPPCAEYAPKFQPDRSRSRIRAGQGHDPGGGVLPLKGLECGFEHGPDKITYGSSCLAFRNRRSVRLNGRTSGPGWRVELFGVSPWVEVRLPRELG